MIVFHDQNGRISGYQIFPANYNGPDSHVIVADGADLSGKKVSGGALVAMTQEEIDAEVAANAAASLTEWRNTCEVTKRQALLSLYSMDDGVTLTAIKAAVTAAGGLTQIDWESASTFKRMNSTVLAVAQAMGWTDEQLDALFQAAEQVPT